MSNVQVNCTGPDLGFSKVKCQSDASEDDSMRKSLLGLRMKSCCPTTEPCTFTFQEVALKLIEVNTGNSAASLSLRKYSLLWHLHPLIACKSLQTHSSSKFLHSANARGNLACADELKHIAYSGQSSNLNDTVSYYWPFFAQSKNKFYSVIDRWQKTCSPGSCKLSILQKLLKLQKWLSPGLSGRQYATIKTISSIVITTPKLEATSVRCLQDIGWLCVLNYVGTYIDFKYECSRHVSIISLPSLSCWDQECWACIATWNYMKCILKWELPCCRLPVSALE